MQVLTLRVFFCPVTVFSTLVGMACFTLYAVFMASVAIVLAWVTNGFYLSKRWRYAGLALCVAVAIPGIIIGIVENGATAVRVRYGL